MPQDFQDQLIEFLPKMRIWALALTRNRAAAEDLTQDVATKARIVQVDPVIHVVHPKGHPELAEKAGVRLVHERFREISPRHA